MEPWIYIWRLGVESGQGWNATISLILHHFAIFVSVSWVYPEANKMVRKFYVIEWVLSCELRPQGSSLFNQSYQNNSVKLTFFLLKKKRMSKFIYSYLYFIQPFSTEFCWRINPQCPKASVLCNELKSLMFHSWKNWKNSYWNRFLCFVVQTRNPNWKRL